MSENKPRVGFTIENDSENDSDENVTVISIENSSKKKKSLKKLLYKTFGRSLEQQQEPNNKNKRNKTEEKIVSKQKIKLIRYLSEERPIIQTKIEINDNERRLLRQISSNTSSVDDLDKYFKFPELKAKNQLWKIPYHFSNDDLAYDDDELSKSVDRFGSGIKDGCTIGLNMPKIYSNKKEQKPKTWNDLLDLADEALELFSTAKWNRLYRNRRGSILQPQHIFLTPNPEIGRGGRFFSSNKTLREWCSETNIDKTLTDDEPQLLDAEFKSNILRNASINDISHMLYPEVKLNFDQYGMMSESDMLYIQAVSKRRRQSLVPPTLTGDSTSFRRQSFAGGLLPWSAEVESNHQKEIYQQKVALINPDFKPYKMERLDSIATITSMDLNPIQQSRTNEYQTWSIDDYPSFDPDSNEETQLFANELLLIVRKYFNSIKSSEIINLMLFTVNRNVMNSCTHIKGLLHFQNRIIRLIATYVLKEDQLEHRVNAILFFIRVIRHSYRLNNWHSVKLITESLQCPPVVRLKETWRKITFNHSEDYCFFIKISEDLDRGKQWETYDTASKFIPIFDDVIEIIKERCGLMIVQIQQYRLHSTWGQLKRDDDTVSWIDNQVTSLMQDCPWPSINNEKRTSKLFTMISNKMNNVADKQHKTTSLSSSSSKNNKFKDNKKKNKKKTTELLKRMMKNIFDKMKTTDSIGATNERQSPKMDNEIDDDDDGQQQQQSDDEEQTDQDIYQRRLLKGSFDVVLRKTSKETNRVSMDSMPLSSLSRSSWTSATGIGHQQSVGGGIGGLSCGIGGSKNLPSCKKFWSIADFTKLRQQDRELVKQQIVRTLVEFQKKTFYVFEDRSSEIRDFLLNARCNSMDACMLRSTEQEKKQDDRHHLKQLASNRPKYENEDQDKNIDNEGDLDQIDQPKQNQEDKMGKDQKNNQSTTITTRSTMMIVDADHPINLNGEQPIQEQQQQQVQMMEPKKMLNIEKTENKDEQKLLKPKTKRRVMFAE